VIAVNATTTGVMMKIRGPEAASGHITIKIGINIVIGSITVRTMGEAVVHREAHIIVAVALAMIEGGTIEGGAGAMNDRERDPRLRSIKKRGTGKKREAAGRHIQRSRA
jgi:hypothetical protein